MSERMFINAVGNIGDEYIIEALPVYRNTKGFLGKYLKIAVAIFILVFIGGFSVNVVAPIYARDLPFVGSVFTYIQDKLHVSGIYSQYAAEVGNMDEDNGITITLSETYCDGVNLYMSFIVESNEPFSSFFSEGFVKNQLNYDGVAYIEYGGERKQLNDFGIAGFEGEYIDDNKFVGVDVFSLTGSEFPEEFIVDMKIKAIGDVVNNRKKNYIKGNWRLSSSVVTNDSDVVTYSINKSENGHTIDKIVVTPVMVSIYTSYPDKYSGTTNYELRVYSDGTTDDVISIQGEYGNTSGITQIPRNRIKGELHIYAIDVTTLCKAGVERGKQAESKEHALVEADVLIE